MVGQYFEVIIMGRCCGAVLWGSTVGQNCGEVLLGSIFSQ